MTAVQVQITPRPDVDPAPSEQARPFPSYTELPRWVARGTWKYVRVVTVLGYLALVVTLIADPADGLFALWNVIVPLLPVLFFVAPGVWRNLCPLAAANQTPRVLRRSRSLKAPRWLSERGHLVAIAAFAIAVALRKPVLNTHGLVTGCVLAAIISSALIGGLAYRGKSGWCSSICPLLPVQRLYGQTPFVTSPNSHCDPCVGCTKNCYDFNPAVAYQSDLTDADPDWGASKRLFAGMFPGIVLGYFLIPGPPVMDANAFWARLAGAAAVSVGAYFAAQAITRLSWVKVSALWGATAFTAFYWFTGVVLAADLTRWTGADVSWARWPIRAIAIALALVWLSRTMGVERRLRAIAAAVPKLRLHDDRLRGLQAEAAAAETPRLLIEPDGREILTRAGLSVLDAVEAAGLPLEAGCRMGLCGADPIAVRAGAENLAPLTGDEQSTLRRLCLPEGNRLACQAVVLGNCTISLTPDRAGPPARRADPAVPAAPVAPPVASRGKVLVIGGGIAGVTVVEKIRTASPDTELALVNREPYHLYNRMGISRVIYGRSAMAGLYLLPEDWFDTQHVDTWLNTVVRSVELEEHTALLATGEVVEWDHLVFASGSRPILPPIAGLALSGSYVLRAAADAEAIRAHAQQVGASTAVVCGGGLLGLEGAYSLHRLGLRVTVLERSGRLLADGVDARASTLLHGYLSRHGIDLRTDVSVTALRGDAAVQAVELDDGSTLPCELFLCTVGVQPNAEPAREAGLSVNRGIVVDDGMHASATGVFACGDVAELDGRTWGLWPTALRQAEVAAANILGGDEHFTATEPPLVLKGVGVGLTSVGMLQPSDRHEELINEDAGEGRYSRILVADGRIVGGVLYGYTREVPHLHRLINDGTDVGWMLPRLRTGDLSVLGERRAETVGVGELQPAG